MPSWPHRAVRPRREARGLACNFARCELLDVFDLLISIGWQMGRLRMVSRRGLVGWRQGTAGFRRTREDGNDEWPRRRRSEYGFPGITRALVTAAAIALVPREGRPAPGAAPRKLRPATAALRGMGCHLRSVDFG